MVVPRYVIMHLAMTCLGMTTGQIGKVLGAPRSFHRFSMGSKCWPSKIEKNPQLGERIERLRKQLLEA